MIKVNVMSEARVIAAVIFLCAAAKADFMRKTVLYETLTHGYAHFRIPALIEAPDGTVLAFAEARRQRSDTGNIDTVVRRSFDGGATWQDMQIVWDEGENTCGNPTAVVDADTKRIWLFLTHNIGSDRWDTLVKGTSQGIRSIWSCYSDDNGASWSSPVRHSDIKPPASDVKNYWDAVGPGNGIQLKNGVNAGRLIIPANARNIQSDDHGKRWYEGKVFYGGCGDEGAVVEISGGAIMRNDRANALYKDYNRRVVCFSYDQGDTWTPITLDGSLITPICQGSIIAADLDGGRALFFSNPAALTRSRMTVKLSFNDGLSWPVSKLITKRKSAYSSLAYLRGGYIGLLYEDGENSPYQNITFVRFTPRWLESKSVVRWDFEDFQNGGDVVDSGGYGFTGKVQGAVTAAGGSDLGGTQRAASFDGGYISLDNKITEGLTDVDSKESFVIEAVFRTTRHKEKDFANAGTILAKCGDADKASLWLGVQGGAVKLMINDGEVQVSVSGKGTVSDGKWHKVRAQRDAENRKLNIYLDGTLDGQTADITIGSLANQCCLTAGALDGGAGRFAGVIDSVELFAAAIKDIDDKTDYRNCKSVIVNTTLLKQ